jgi:hypothetical protein
VLQVALQANERASRAEARAAIAEDAARRSNQAAVEANRPKGVDPLDRLAAEDVTLAPDERKRLLGNAIEGRARAIAGKAIDVMREEGARREQALESRLALDNVINARPELNDPTNASNFAAAMSKAKFEYDSAGVGYSSAQLTQRAALVYDNMFRKVEKPPFVEGGNQPNMGGMPQPNAGPQGPSFLEETYGIPAGKIQPLFNANNADEVRKMNNDYVEQRNAPLMKAGINTSMAEITRGGNL